MMNDNGGNYMKDIESAKQHTMTSIFVYGTLLKGQRNHDAYLKNCYFAGGGTIKGYDMYDLGTYPGIKQGNGKVTGEVYYVTDEELEKVDCLEDEGNEYIKTPAKVYMENGEELEAMVYLYNWSIEGCRRIEGRYDAEKISKL